MTQICVWSVLILDILLSTLICPRPYRRGFPTCRTQTPRRYPMTAVAPPLPREPPPRAEQRPALEIIAPVGLRGSGRGAFAAHGFGNDIVGGFGPRPPATGP